MLHLLFRDAGVEGEGGEQGGQLPPSPQFLADQLTLFQPGGQIIPPTPRFFGRCGVSAFNLKMLQYHPSFSGVLCSILFRDIFGDIYRVVDCGGGFGPMNPPFRDNTSHKNGDN